MESKDNVLIDTAASVKNMSKEDLSKLELQLRKQLNSFKTKHDRAKKQKEEKESLEKDLKVQIEISTLPNIASKKDLTILKVSLCFYLSPIKLMYQSLKFKTCC